MSQLLLGMHVLFACCYIGTLSVHYLKVNICPLGRHFESVFADYVFFLFNDTVFSYISQSNKEAILIIFFFIYSCLFAPSSGLFGNRLFCLSFLPI